ncbi:MAG: ATP-dependent DNA helicase [Candidatus Roizmanbacteria bacterium]
MSHFDFDTQYKKLNKAQKEAVDSIEGPVMVIAGPGTGKTQILTLRIANILKQTQITPANILAITYTNAAATNMKERLAAIIGPQAYGTNIFTYHAFCQQVIANYPDDFWDILGARLADQVEQIEIVEHIIDREKFKYIRPYGKPYFYVSAIIKAISDLKREGVGPEEFGRIIEDDRREFDATPDKESTRSKGSLKVAFRDWEKRIQKNHELARVYELYQIDMKKNDIYDYNDLIMQVLHKLTTDQDFVLRLMERYQYVLVDEHQDSNNAQNKILEKLMSFHDSPNIFVVGDEKQAIFRFQGASIANFRGFTKLYPDAKIITLVDNYRSTQTILDSAIALIPTAKDQKLTAQAGHADKPIVIVDTPDEQTMLEELASSIQRDISHGIPPHEVAVLVRTNKHVKVISDHLQSRGIQTYSSKSQNIFETVTIDRLFRLLRAVNSFGDEVILFKVLTLDFLGFDPLLVYQVTLAARQSRSSLAELLSNQSELVKIGGTKAIPMYEFFHKLGSWSMLAHNTDVHTLIHTVAEESELLKYLAKSENPIEAFAPLRLLYDTLTSLDREADWKLADFFAYYAKVEEHGVRIPVELFTIPTGKIQVMTAHGSKGLEFDHVYIPFAQERVWSGRGKADGFVLPVTVYGISSTDTQPVVSQSDDEDEYRRLFFVALTRARKQLIISFSHHNSTGEKILPAVYLSNISDSLKTCVTIEGTNDQTFNFQTSSANPVISSRTRFLDFVHGSFYRYGLSVSALNNYLQDPWKYFYVNLVRVPQGKSETLMYGNAIHNALSYFFIHYKESGDKSLDYLLNAFEMSAKKEHFSTDELTRALDRGREHLRTYYFAYEDVLPRNVRVKQRIKVELPGSHPELQPIPLNGELDLMEYLDMSGKRLNVRDWKTGKVRSRNEIMGDTKDADGGYYRQLVFYKLLLSLQYPDLKMESGMIDFVQADEKGKLHQESFEISTEEVAELKKTIVRVTDEILSLSFWNTPCAPDSDWYTFWNSLQNKEFEEGLF